MTTILPLFITLSNGTGWCMLQKIFSWAAEMIFTIHYIRGVAALLVVLFHYRADLNNIYVQKDLGDLLFGSGMAGVDLFFIISGFIIVLSTKKKETNSVLKFIVRRFFRIYPLLILSVLSFWLLMTDWANFSLLLKSIIPMQLDYNQASPYFGYNLLNPAWTLTYEIYFYAVFCISLLLSHQYRTLVCSIVLIGTMLLAQHFHGGLFIDANRSISTTGNSVIAGFLKISASPMLIEFAIGMLIAEIYDKIPHRNIGGNSWLLLALGLSIYFILFASKAYFTHGVFGFGAWALFLIVPALIYEKTNEIKKSKILSFLGDISYPLYITHIVTAVTISNYNVYVPAYSYASGVSILMIYLVASIFVAYLAHMLIEKPMHKLSRKIINKL